MATIRPKWAFRIEVSRSAPSRPSRASASESGVKPETSENRSDRLDPLGPAGGREVPPKEPGTRCSGR